MSSDQKTSDVLKGARQDEVLVGECLRGSEQAWSALIDKYKNLIFSIPVKYGFSREDATDIFQTVCLTMLHELSELREPRALAAWLIQLTAHKCIRLRNEQRTYLNLDIHSGCLIEADRLPEELLQELEREQVLRLALTEASPECKRLIDLLFFANPPLRYDEAAQALGLAKGSMGATRMRCLDRLRRSLEKKGFR